MSIYEERKKHNFRNTYVIAEFACGYEGDVSLLKKWIKQMSKIGPDAIKLHIHYADNYITPEHKIYPFYKKMEVDYDTWPEIFKLIKDNGMDVVIMPNEEKGLKFMNHKLVDGVVLHSANLPDLNMVKKLRKCKKPIFVGVGGTYIDELEYSLSLLEKNEIILMLGFQNYPTQLEDHKFNYIQMYSELFNLPVGFDDHVEGGTFYSYVLPIIAKSKGAMAIEKHVTSKRSLKRVDYQSAMEFSEFKTFLEQLRILEPTLSKYPLKYSQNELKARKLVKKQLVAVKNIKKGIKLTAADVVFKRCSKTSIPPIKYEEILGKKTSKNIKKNSPITMDSLVW